MSKPISAFLLISFTLTFSFGQAQKGTVIHEKFLAASIAGNPANEDALRGVTIYLPPDYYKSKQRVSYIDKHFRTIPHKDSRGISGASMDGNGALKMGMLFPDVFSTVYATTPATLNWSDGINPHIEAFKAISEMKNDSDVFNTDRPLIMVDLARTYSPNLNKPPFYADMPAYYIGDSLVIDTAVVNKWTANLKYC